MRCDIAAIHLSRILLAVCLIAATAACGSPSDTPPGEDVGVPRPDGGCSSNSECSDDVFCNGVERCMDGMCLPSSAPACAGTDRCNEAAETCGGTCVDADGDGACAEDDCDDANPNRFPGALERCDGADQDCNPATLGPDGDRDGSPAIDCCNPQSSGTALCGSDCDDTRATVNTSALESCNGRDDDCDSMIDELVQLTFYRDMDGDNFGDLSMTMQGCSAPTGWALAGGDCNDGDARFQPSGTDSCDLVGDDNCSGAPDEGCDCILGATQACGPIAQHMIGICLRGTQRCIGGRWESSCPGSVPPAAESCNSLDDDCDGASDDGVCVACPTGYAGVDGMCTDINECDTSACGPTSTGCANMDGTYACTCAPGYAAPARGGTCVNVNECAASTNPCGGGACTDLPGTYRCTACPANYAEVTTPVPACAWNSPVLAELRTSNGVLGPLFSGGTLSYRLPISLRRETLSLTPIVPAGFVGTVTVQGEVVAPGVASAAIPLPFGGLDITVVVRAATGREQTYVVRAVRGFEPGPTSAYVKASNTGAFDGFGYSVALSSDGSTLAVGAYREASNATGVNGNQDDNSSLGSGAVYVFRRTGSTWAQEAYVKASNTGASDQFGWSLALSSDGSSLAVGAYLEDSNATGVNGNQAENSSVSSGAVYVFRRTGSTWAQEAYVKASNTGVDDRFGSSVALSSDGSTLAVGAYSEASNATGVDGNQADNSAGSGAVYVFRRTGSTWAQEAYVKASNTGVDDRFGWSLALSADGSTLAVGAYLEESNATGVDGNQANNSAPRSGAVYVFRRTGSTWVQEAYVKASNTGTSDNFGYSVALSSDGSTLAVGANQEGSNATGINGNQADNSSLASGAVYVFLRTGSTWTQEAYVKASNTGTNDQFGFSVALSSDGSTLAVGAYREASNATGVNGNQADNSASQSGAVYVFRRTGSTWAQEAYVKASNTGGSDQFGSSVALSSDGSTLAVGARGEASSATGVDGNQADNSADNSGAVYVSDAFRGPSLEQYLKASNTGGNDNFGVSVALSSDGSTLAVGAYREASNATGVDGNQADNSGRENGAVYVFRRTGSTWAQEAYIKASNSGTFDQFGWSLALSSDGSTLAVGASGEDSNATGVDGNQADNSASNSGAVYVFRHTGSTWAQEAYIKASNSGAFDLFGWSLALSSDSSTLAVGAYGEASNATGVDGNQVDNSSLNSGAVYVFRRTGSTWAQEAYVKASNTGGGDQFGRRVALSSDGSTLAVGAYGEASNATGVNGNQVDNSAGNSGAVYVFRRTGSTWAQEAYVKASNTAAGDQFGSSVALSSDGSTLAVGASQEGSNATGVNGNQADNSAGNSGAVYVFRRTGSTWAQEAYVKASNTGTSDNFGSSVALSSDGSTLAVGASQEGSNARGVNGNQADNSATQSGAVYVFRRTGSTWAQEAYVKASNTGVDDRFGSSVALSSDGSALAVGALIEDSNATGVNGNQADNSAIDSGAVYTYRY
jgi:hypothetical protein